MRGTNFRKKWSGLGVIVLVLFALAQAQTGKKPIGYDVYDSWKSIQGTKLSGDGRWLVYSLAPGEGDPELVVLDLQSGKESRFPRGRDAVISADDRFVVYTIVPPKAEVDKAKKEKKKPEEQPKNGLGIINLQTGQQVSVDRVKNFKLAEDSGKFVAYLLEPPLPKEAAKDQPKKEEEEKKEPEKKEPEAKPAEKKEPEQKAGEKKEEKKPEKKKEPGTELVIRNLETNETISVQEVSEYTWSKNGRYLAYAVSSKKPEDDGAFILDPSSGKTIALLKGQGHYVKLVFDERGQQPGLSQRPGLLPGEGLAIQALPLAGKDGRGRGDGRAENHCPSPGLQPQRKPRAFLFQGWQPALFWLRPGSRAGPGRRARTGQGGYLELDRP